VDNEKAFTSSDADANTKAMADNANLFQAFTLTVMRRFRMPGCSEGDWEVQFMIILMYTSNRYLIDIFMRMWMMTVAPKYSNGLLLVSQPKEMFSRDAIVNSHPSSD
jgi:hypothetical protein